MLQTVYTQNHSYIMPDREITAHDPALVYVPLRGYSSCLAVFDLDDNCIGWINTRTLGFEDARAWMIGQGWTPGTPWNDGGY